MEDKTQRLEPEALEEDKKTETLSAPVSNTASQEAQGTQVLEGAAPDAEAKPKLTKGRKIAIGVGVGVAVLLIVGGIAYAQQQYTAQPAVKETPVNVQAVESHSVSVKVNCDGWNADTSTPIVVSVYKDNVKDTLTSTDENVTAPDPLFTKEVNAGEQTDLTDITEAGTYTIAITGSPVLEDGTIFDLPEPQVIDFNGLNGDEVDLTLTPKAADQVTEADIAAAQATAAAAGADTAKVTNNAAKANEKAANAQGGAVASGTANAATKSNASKTGTTLPSQGGNSNSSANTPSAGGNTGGNGSGATPSTPSQPAHQHSWEPIKETINHPAETEKVETTYYICNGCNAEFSSESAAIAHKKAYGPNSGHDGWHTDVKTTTKTIKSAYSETVVTGYRCSTCGATK